MRRTLIMQKRTSVGLEAGHLTVRRSPVRSRGKAPRWRSACRAYRRISR